MIIYKVSNEASSQDLPHFKFADRLQALAVHVSYMGANTDSGRT